MKDRSTKLFALGVRPFLFPPQRSSRYSSSDFSSTIGSSFLSTKVRKAFRFFDSGNKRACRLKFACCILAIVYRVQRYTPINPANSIRDLDVASRCSIFLYQFLVPFKQVIENAARDPPRATMNSNFAFNMEETYTEDCTIRR